jgi:hypothetical protein
MKATAGALQRLIDYALSVPIEIGYVLNAHLRSDGSIASGCRECIDCFLEEFGHRLSDGRPPRIRRDRAYVAVHHPSGCFLVEI